MKVLIIDDEEDTRSIASMSLSILGGVDVVEADGGLDGIAKAEQNRPDVILLDMMMPVMDGCETLQELLKNPRTKDIPVIFLTAKAMSTEVERLKRMGAIAVLTKPFDPTTLAAQVEQILSSNGLKVTPSAVSPAEPDYATNSAQPSPAPPPGAQGYYQTPASPPGNSNQVNSQPSAQPTTSNYQEMPASNSPKPSGASLSISTSSMFSGFATSPMHGNNGSANAPPYQAGRPENPPQPMTQQQPFAQQSQTGPQPQMQQNTGGYQQYQLPAPQSGQQNIQQNVQQNQVQSLTSEQQQRIAQQSVTSDYPPVPQRQDNAAYQQNQAYPGVRDQPRSAWSDAQGNAHPNSAGRPAPPLASNQSSQQMQPQQMQPPASPPSSIPTSANHNASPTIPPPAKPQTNNPGQMQRAPNVGGPGQAQPPTEAWFYPSAVESEPDPWVIAATSNAQSQSVRDSESKTAANALRTPAKNTPANPMKETLTEAAKEFKAPIKEPVKEPVKEPAKEPAREPAKRTVKEPLKEQAKEPAPEPAKKKFAHPWGPPQAPNWSDDVDASGRDGSDSGKPSKRKNEDKK